ncbi:MAG: TniQ family protein [Phycicoccus sp.]
MRVHLPARPTPDRVEALRSYADRIATANGLRIRELLGYQPTPSQWRFGDDHLLEAMADLTGTPVGFLRDMTHARHIIAAHGARLGFIGLRPHNQLVVCHHCYARDGVRLRQWEHALVVDCCDCGRLLEPLKETRPVMGRPRSETRYRLSNTRLEIEWSLDGGKAARDNFRSIRRAASPILRGISPTWPRFADPLIKHWHARAAVELETHPAKRDARRPASPYATTVVIMHAWDEIVIGGDHDMPDRLERRFPDPTKPPRRRSRP